jgi:DNA-binding MarR family transcriptional regulator
MTLERKARELNRYINVLVFIYAEGTRGPSAELSRQELIALRLLGFHGRRTMTKLAEEAGVAPATMTGIVEKLVTRGLLVRQRRTDDRRVVEVTLTPQGEVAFKDSVELHMRMARELLLALDEGEQEAMLMTLRKITGVGHLDESTRGPARVVAAGAVVAMVAATVAIALWIISVKNTPPEAPSTPMKRIPVETVVVRHETFTHQMHALGTVTPIREASVASQVVGPIVAIPEGVELGAPIEKGQLLAQIKPTSYEIAHQEAEALLAQRRASYQEQGRESEKRTVLFKIAQENVRIVKAEADRIENLFKEGVVSHSETDAARGRLTQARIEYERLRSEYRSADATPP